MDKTKKVIVIAVSGLGEVVVGSVLSVVLRKIGVSYAKYRVARKRTLNGPVIVFGKSEGRYLAWNVSEGVEMLTLSGVRGKNSGSQGFIGYKDQK